MAIRNWQLEWLSHNSNRRFPLANDASCHDTTGDFELPSDFLVGLYLAVPFSLNVNPASFTIASIQVFATGFSVTIGYWDGSVVIPVAAGSFARSSHAKYQAYPLRGLGEDFHDARGHITIGNLTNIDLQPAGDWQFDLVGGRLEVDAIRPQIRGVQQLRVQNGAELSDPIAGDIVLRAGQNIRLTPVIEEGEDPIIVIDAIEGEGLSEECVCEGEDSPPPPIRTINRIGGDPNGNFTMLGSDCLVLNEISNGLQMDDSCAKPCCGCKELEVVTAALENFGQQAATLENFLVSLEARVSQMDQVVLGSKLGDLGCWII